MSTYTVAFAVGEYDYVESETAKCVKVGINGLTWYICDLKNSAFSPTYLLFAI